MDIITIKQRLHNYLEEANDKKVRAMYTMMETDVEKSMVEYSDEFKTELDRRNKAYKNGTATIITPEESKKRIKKLLKRYS